MKNRILVAASLVALMCSTIVLAQQKAMRINIPFQFTVERKVLPAGHYEFSRETNDVAIRISSMDKGASVEGLVITRLGTGIHTTEKDSHVVLDKVGNAYTLSEVWFAGIDGFLLTATKGKHEHKMLDVAN